MARELARLWTPNAGVKKTGAANGLSAFPLSVATPLSQVCVACV
jgi:hypothetical protein